MEFLKSIGAKLSRREFSWAGVLMIIVAVVTRVTRGTGKRVNESAETQRFLTREGKLVEAKRGRLLSRKMRASSDQVRNWIWNRDLTTGNKS
jgi:hypothetical protein